MTHKPESRITPAVVSWFEDRYGESRVEEPEYLEDERWFADIVVEVGWCTLYVEVENDAGSVRTGFAQAAGYAGSDPVRGVPLVVTPENHIDRRRAAALRSYGVLIREFDAENGRFV